MNSIGTITGMSKSTSERIAIGIALVIPVVIVVVLLIVVIVVILSLPQTLNPRNSMISMSIVISSKKLFRS